MATKVIDPQAKRKARRAYADIRKTHGIVQTALDSVWHWLNGVASGAEHLFGANVVSAFRTVWATIKELAHLYREVVAKYFSIYYWVQIHVLKFLFHLIMHKYDAAIAKLNQQVKRLIRLIYVTSNTVLTTCLTAIRAERTARVRAVQRAEAMAKLEIRSLHQTIEREAASAYQVQRDQRLNVVIRLLEFAVTRNPELRTIVGDAIKAIIDLIGADDPLARIALGFVINDVIDKLGVDRLVGTLVRDLLAPILGEPKPRNLHDVVMDMGQRLVAAEGFEAQFMEDGGSEVEQAGKLWRDLTSPAAAAGLVAFSALAITHPQGWADTINGTIGKLGTDLVDATASLVKGG